MSPILEVEDLRLTYSGGNAAIRGVSFSLPPAECLALVGESGCGKTSIARAIAGLLPQATRLSGRIDFQGHDLIGMDEHQRRPLRGRSIGFVPQDPFAACNPLHPVIQHLAEPWLAHGLPVPRDKLHQRLADFGIEDSEERIRQMPHQWSGGMLQRAVIAAALAHRPPLLIADEPTSALDTELADQTLRYLRASGAAIILVSHDLDLVSRHADRVAVCYAGQIVEIDNATAIQSAPRHPYTAALGQALPRGKRVIPRPLAGSPPQLDKPIAGCSFAPRCALATEPCMTAAPDMVGGVACHDGGLHEMPASPTGHGRPAVASGAEIVLEARGVSKTYGLFSAVAPVDLTVRAGEVVGICGPSGSGKSTLLRLLGDLEAMSGGTVVIIGSGDQPFAGGRVMPIFQDPTRSLNPRWPIWRSVIEPITRGRWSFNRAEQRELARPHLGAVGLGHLDLEARPFELSVGQCQRVAIARALAAQPAVIIADEPTSALDAAASANVMMLFDEAARAGTAVVVVSHNLGVLESLCDRVLTMRRGQLSEREAPEPAMAG